ncbi:UNVERIFIED_CONTAM: hypothetical protein FKN15_004879 [Acipenser sinensis]
MLTYSTPVSQPFPDEAVGQFIPLPAGLDSAYLEERNHTDLEPDRRYLASLPSHVLKNDQVKQFFSPFSVTQNTVENVSALITTNTTSPVLQPSQEQNGILDWLRKLRLHKYYPVFKQLTMEKFLALTEEDLNKYDLTQGAKKKLKTQLELQKDSSSSSGYSSSPSSPMGIQTRDETFESPEDGNRCTEPVLECRDMEKSAVPNHFIAACAARPTAQVLPVQNDTGANSSPPPPPLPVLPTLSSSTPPSRMLSTIRKAERGSSRLPLSPVLSPLYLEERMKTFQVSSGPGSSIKIEKRFPSVNLEMSPVENSAVPAGLVNFGRRTKIGLDVDPRPAQQPGLIIETSTATTATSNTHYHMSHPPLINSRTLPYSANTKVAFSAVSSVPMAAVHGTYCVNSGASPSNNHSPGSSPTLSSIAEISCYSNSSTGSGISNQLPFLHFSPLCNNGYISPQQYNTTTGFSYPMVPPPMYNSSLTPDSMLSSQSGFVMPPMQNFIAGVYQAQGMTGGTSGAGQKKNGNVSCYNCGVSGHRAQDCKQPSMDLNQQGTFRLKYAPAPESVDSAD